VISVVDELRRARRDQSLAVLEGFHAVKHAVRFRAEILRVIAVDRAKVVALAKQVAPDVAEFVGTVVEDVPSEPFGRLSARPVPTGVIGIARRPAVGVAAVRRNAPVVLLEDPRDAANVGAVVRVAAAAGAAGVFVTGERDPWSAEALRGSAGLHFALPVVHGEPDLEGRPLVALDPEGEVLDPRALTRDAVLAFGTERAGLSDELKARADAVLALPMRPGVSSLNLATSVAAVLYAWRLTR
jgi:TrmH family RNA methyltransferase